MSFKIINVQHRHCVFTIDSELRHFFLEDRELLGLLFEAVQIFRFERNTLECLNYVWSVERFRDRYRNSIDKGYNSSWSAYFFDEEHHSGVYFSRGGKENLVNEIYRCL